MLNLKKNKIIYAEYNHMSTMFHHMWHVNFQLTSIFAAFLCKNYTVKTVFTVYNQDLKGTCHTRIVH